MKLTTARLKKLIREELKRMNESLEDRKLASPIGDYLQDADNFTPDYSETTKFTDPDDLEEGYNTEKLVNYAYLQSGGKFGEQHDLEDVIAQLIDMGSHVAKDEKEAMNLIDSYKGIVGTGEDPASYESYYDEDIGIIMLLP